MFERARAYRGGINTIEDQVKLLCKWAVENSNRPLTDVEKEIIKQAIDQSETVEELLSVAFTVMTFQ